jgi:parallel beta-helix repeat protein
MAGGVLRTGNDLFADGASAIYNANGGGDYQIAIYAAVSDIALLAAPVNISPPTITGTANVGQTLTAGAGVWSGSPMLFAYQWKRCDGTGLSCSAIGGATSATYSLTSTDEGSTVVVTVTATNDGGSTAASSLATPVVAANTGFCDLYASSSGSDLNIGSMLLPFKTVTKLIGRLTSGQTGCLSGTFNESVTISTPGITLASLPGQRAKINGGVRLNVTANGVTVRDFDVDGYGFAYSTFRIIGADQAKVINMDITNRNYPNGTSNYDAICLLAGAGATFESDPSYTVWDLDIENSRIHNCGDDAHEHSIYLESTRNAVIRDNYLYGNYGYGISMYPDAQGSLIEYNVIDGNSKANRANLTFSGEAAGGEYSQPHGSDNNTVRYNLISNAATRYNVDSYYPTGSITPNNNQVLYNCVWNAPYGNFGGTDGYTQTNNKNSDPLYVDRSSGDFRLQTASPCTGWGPRTVPATIGAAPAPAPAPAPDFSLSATPASQVVVRGNSTSYTLSLQPTGGFTGTATLSVTGLPAGVTAAFSALSLDSASPATLKVSTATTASRGTCSLTATGVSGGITHSVVVTLQIKRR